MLIDLVVVAVHSEPWEYRIFLQPKINRVPVWNGNENIIYYYSTFNVLFGWSVPRPTDKFKW